uniref:uncharacterized protein LOC117272090 n=1 Tax=Epinephelus lanceolatus TaxID=310571 RepID=UPI0014480F3C|nr:uncharacterized protein LOC117272090 [Epinephelus lanceolatus]
MVIKSCSTTHRSSKTRLLKPADIKETSSRHQGDVQPTSRRHPADIKETSSRHQGDVQLTSRRHPADIKEMSSQHPADIKETRHQGDIHLTSSRHQGDIHLTSRRRPADIKETSSQHQGDIHPTSRRRQANIRETSSRHPSDIKETSSRHPPDIKETSSRHPADIKETSSGCPADIQWTTMTHHQLTRTLCSLGGNCTSFLSDHHHSRMSKVLHLHGHIPTHHTHLKPHLFPTVDVPDHTHYIIGSVILLVGVMGMLGNGLVIYVFCRSPTLRLPSNLLVVNLAAADFMMSLTQSPVFFVSSRHHH